MEQRSPWVEGITDAVAFVVGALVGYGAGRLLGLDIFAPGYGAETMGAILLVGVGAGLGRRVMRGLMARSRDTGDAN